MATLQQLESALVNAHKAGDSDAARRLAAVIRQERERRDADPSIELMEQAPVNESGGVPEQVPGTVAPEPEPTFGDKMAGAAEAGATMLTGMTGGLAGQIGGAVEGIIKELFAGEFGSQDAADRIEQLAMERAQQLTNLPESELGQEYVQNIGRVLAPLAAVPPLAETQTVVNAATQVPARALATQPSQRVGQAAREISARVRERLANDPRTESPGTAGAQAVDPSTLRQAQADELPVPLKLTEGQRTRAFEDQRFERETAKLPEEGAPLRERFEEQNLQLQQNMDAFIDMTGSEITNLRGVGESVEKALRSSAAKSKVRIRALYKDAEKAGELEAPVEMPSFVQHLDDTLPESEVANVLKAVRAKAIQLGAAVEGPDGKLVPQPISLKNAELLRRSINGATDEKAVNIRQASIMKGLIDDSTEGAGGSLYKAARAARSKHAKEFERVGLVKNILGLKRGSDDRAIAVEDVLRKTILEPSSSLDSVRHVRKLLHAAGPEGKQAWKELQGGTLREIQDQMLKNVATNSRGDRVVSPVQLDKMITKLDATGKLDFVFGKKGAEQLRTINDVAKTVLTSPPGTVNTSNTATVLAGLMDVAVTGTTGIPAPIATSFRFITNSIKDKKLRARVKRALEDPNQ